MLKFLEVSIFMILILSVIFIVLPQLSMQTQTDNATTDNYLALSNMQIQIPDFENGEAIPEVHTCMGLETPPLIAIKQIPEGTQSLAFIMDDPDAPVGRWIHWLFWNLPADTAIIDHANLPETVTVGVNSSGKNEYQGPCPPFGTHRYFFKVFALDTILSLDAPSNAAELEVAMKDHIIAAAQYYGTFTRE